jgi:hypothetical protein
MTDDEAVLRLQSIMLDACEGRKDLSLDREYKRLRKPLIRRPDFSDVVPKFVRSHQDLRSFWSYAKGVDDQWEPRRQHVRNAFEPLFDRIEGRTKPPIQSSRWTGRRTPAQQAQIVLALAPDALTGVIRLLEEQERPLHNGGPADPEQLEAIEKLKELRDALSYLITLAENGSDLGAQLAEVRELKNRVLTWSASPYGLNLARLPLLGMSTVLGAGVMYLVNGICPGDGGAMGAAVLTAHAGTAAIKGLVERRSEATRRPRGSHDG